MEEKDGKMAKINPLSFILIFLIILILPITFSNFYNVSEDLEKRFYIREVENETYVSFLPLKQYNCCDYRLFFESNDFLQKDLFLFNLTLTDQDFSNQLIILYDFYLFTQSQNNYSIDFILYGSYFDENLSINVPNLASNYTLKSQNLSSDGLINLFPTSIEGLIFGANYVASENNTLYLGIETNAGLKIKDEKSSIQNLFAGNSSSVEPTNYSLYIGFDSIIGNLSLYFSVNFKLKQYPHFKNESSRHSFFIINEFKCYNISNSLNITIANTTISENGLNFIYNDSNYYYYNTTDEYDIGYNKYNLIGLYERNQSAFSIDYLNLTIREIIIYFDYNVVKIMLPIYYILPIMLILAFIFILIKIKK